MSPKRKPRLSHIDQEGKPSMVDVSGKSITRRTAAAEATVWLGKSIMQELKRSELRTKKGSVAETAILAGVMAAKKTSELIPLCHPLGLEDCQVRIKPVGESLHVETEVVVTARTGAEMEALTAASVAALTIYDMCKAMSHDIRIEQVRLLSKTGGKRDFLRSR